MPSGCVTGACSLTPQRILERDEVGQKAPRRRSRPHDSLPQRAGAGRGTSSERPGAEASVDDRASP